MWSVDRSVRNVVSFLFGPILLSPNVLSMAISDLFSKRQKRLRSELPDVYRYDLPQELKNQIIHIWSGFIRSMPIQDYAEDLFGKVKHTLCMEYGVFELFPGSPNTIMEVCSWFSREEDTEKCLDGIEIVFNTCLTAVDNDYVFGNLGVPLMLGIDECNARFQEHAVGYHFQNGQFVRIDSEFMHKESVVPALTLLNDKKFRGADQEFRSAHEHFRAKRYKECLNDCLKSFESVMKSICDQRQWPYQPSDTAKKLIAICKDHGLFPVFMDNHLNGLVLSLESGVPTARNKLGGHGQGTQPIRVSTEFATYILHLTAANIVFLVCSARAMK